MINTYAWQILLAVDSEMYHPLRQAMSGHDLRLICAALGAAFAQLETFKEPALKNVLIQKMHI